jgi:hypothetical protein
MAVNAAQEKYLVWRQTNGDVVDLIAKHCLKLTERKKRFGMFLVLNYVRFNEYFEDYRDEPYRISNNHAPYIARELLEKYPAMRDFMRTNRVVGE